MKTFHHVRKALLLSAITFITVSSQAHALTININWDSSVTNGSCPNQAQFQSAVNKAVQFLQSTYTNPGTININVGCGEIDGTTLGSGTLGESAYYFYNGYSASSVESMLKSLPQSSSDLSAYVSFPPASLYTTPGGFAVNTAEGKMLGTVSANSTAIDGFVGFATMYSWTYDNTSGVAGGTFDLEGTALHEITEIMGRWSGINTNGNAPAYTSVMDLFRYSGPALPTFSNAGYLSIDQGVTDLRDLNTASGGDSGDWANSDAGDAMLAFSNSGTPNVFTPQDVTVMNILGFTTAAPGAPTNLIASAGNSQVALTWKAGSNASSYNVMRSSNGSAMASIASVTSLNYTDTAVTNGTAYTYGITAVNAVGTSPMSNQVTAIPNPPQPPAAPANLSASAGNAQVALSWQASVNATFYNVLRSSNGSAMNAVATVNALTYMDTSAANGTTYTYAVVAGNTAGTSGMSNQVSATPVAPVQVVPPAPSGLRALVGKSGNKRNPTYKVNLSWTQSGSASITQEKIYRTPAWSTGSPKLISAATLYTDSPVTHGTTYTYYVTAVNAVGESAPSNTVTVTP